MGYHIFQTNLNVFVCDGVDMKFDVVVVVMFLSGVNIMLIWQTSLIYIHTYLPTYLHTYIHTYTHTHIHTYTHKHTHMYVYMCACLFFLLCVVSLVFTWCGRVPMYGHWGPTDMWGDFSLSYTPVIYIYILLFIHTYDIRLIMNSIFNLW